MATGQSTTTYKDIPGFPGYRVGDDGSVWSAWVACRFGRKLTDRWKQMKTPPNAKGYLRVNLSLAARKTYRTLRVHRLVLEVFIGPCPEGMEARHLNGIKADNRLENLAWGTPEENRSDNHDLGVYAHGEAHTQVKLTESDVRSIRDRYAAGGIFMRELAAEYGVELTTIHAIVHRRSWKHVV